jgi:cytochrome c biogenesis protein CcdA
MFLQQKLKVFMGSFLIVIGVILLDVFKFALSGANISVDMQKKLANGGLAGAAALGIIFALSFCPVSAALFFGSTFGLAMQHQSRFLIPFLYGIGTATPVVVFAFVIAFSAHAVGNVFNKITAFEKWARKISGIVFIGAGIYMVLTINLHLF